MDRTYQKLIRLGIDLAPLGIERRTENIPYFCTPKGASILGWAGVDGIHYCRIRGFGDMVFAVSPMNAPRFVRPIAENFTSLLRLLLENTNLVVTRETILQVVWGTDISVESRTVDMHIRTLRKKLGDAGRYICTVRKVGYKLADNEEGEEE